MVKYEIRRIKYYEGNPITETTCGPFKSPIDADKHIPVLYDSYDTHEFSFYVGKIGEENSFIGDKLLIVGSRDFTDYKYAESKINILIDKLKHSVAIVSGGARGADAIAEKYAAKHHYPMFIYEADWDKYKKSAGYIRNEIMAKVVTHAIVFWDGESKGTYNMIKLLEKYKVPKKIFMI